MALATTMVIKSEKMFEIFGKMYRKKSWTVNLAPAEVPPDDLLHATRPILRVGHIAGIVPIQGLWRKGPDLDLEYKRKSFIGVINLTIIIIMVINVVMNAAGMTRRIMSGETNPIQIAWAIAPFMFYSMGTYVCIHFSMYAERLISLYSTWRSTTAGMMYSRGGKETMYKVRFWGFVILFSALCENTIYHTRHDCHQTDCNDLERHGKKLSEMNFLEEYYWREHGKNWAQFPYNPVVAVVLFFVNKVAVFATNYADVTIMSMGWLISAKLKDFNEQVASRIEDQSICWLQTRREFMGLYRLLEQIHAFLSPIIFTSYTLMTELMSTQIYLGITTDAGRPLMDKVYSIWSFVHLIIRLVLISVVCSRIPERCNELLFLIQKCPSDKFGDEVERLERLVATPIGLTGLGCFRITKPFMLSVIHVIFTCEIIFLQTGPQGTKQ